MGDEVGLAKKVALGQGRGCRGGEQERGGRRSSQVMEEQELREELIQETHEKLIEEYGDGNGKLMP